MRQSIRIFGDDTGLHNSRKRKISMYKYIDKILTELPIDMNGTARTPGSQWLDTFSM